MNAMDRAIAAVSPRWALKREIARRGLAVLARHGGSRGDRKRQSRYLGKAEDWDRNTGNPDDARSGRIVDRMTLLRLVARDPFARKILNVLVNNAVGWGITGAPKGPKAVVELWNAWIKVCDFYGRLDLYGLQELAVRTMFHLGEVFIVFRTVKLPRGDMGIPLRLQLIDPGMLATHLTAPNIVNGVEYDADGVAVAYHFRRARAGVAWSTTDTVRFPAEDVIHLFVQEQVGQRHGTSVFEPVIKRLGDIDEAVEAEIVRKNIEACFVGLITPPDDGDQDEDFGDVEASDRADRFDTESLEPGMLTRLRPGEDVKFGEPKASGGLNDILKWALMASAAGAGVMYEHASGDFSNVNYSSYRAGGLDFQRSIGRIQFNTIVPVALDRIAMRFQHEARIRGRISARSYETKWTPPPFENVDPGKEAAAQVLLMSAGLESRRNIVNGRGYDFDALMTEIAADQETQTKLGLAFQGDPITGAALDATPDGTEHRLLLLALARRIFQGNDHA